MSSEAEPTQAPTIQEIMGHMQDAFARLVSDLRQRYGQPVAPIDDDWRPLTPSGITELPKGKRRYPSMRAHSPRRRRVQN